MRIAIIVDNPYRDLPGLVLLAARLCQSGATCYLVPLNLYLREVTALAPDFVLLTSLRGPRQPLARNLVEAGVQIGVLDTEGGVMPSLEMYEKMTSPDLTLFRQVSCFCSWGPRLAGFVKKEGWYDDNQVVVTGAPRFDFYAPRWREAALGMSKGLDEWPKPIILVNGSFPRANPAFLTPAGELRSWGALGFERDYMVRHQSIQHQSMLEMAGIANHLAARFPKSTIVYRPHPFERVETYRELLKPFDNLHLLKVGTIEGWILRASAVIQHHCTTAIEAGMVGKPALLPNWLPIAQPIESTEVVSIKCESQSEMDDRLEQILAGKNSTDSSVAAVEKVIRDWFYMIDGAAHERVATAILSRINNGGDQPVDVRMCRRIHHAGQGKPSAKARIGNVVRMGFDLPVTWSFRYLRDKNDVLLKWDRSEKHFNAEAVKHLIRALGPFDTSLIVSATEEGRDYRFRYTAGRSVSIQPLPSKVLT